MIPQSDPLPPELSAAFAGHGDRLGRLGSPLLYFSSTGSTNDLASLLATHEGAVVIADAQTAGRGRRGRTWFSPPLSGLYVSVVLHFDRSTGDRSTADGSSRDAIEAQNVGAARARSLVTLAAGVALAEGVRMATGLQVDIKWPNDLLVGGRKLAGILAEAVAPQAVVLGYGINVSAEAYPRDLVDRATSLEAELGRPIDRAMLAVETLAALARRYDDLLAGRFDAILVAWRAHAPGSTGRRVQWTTESGNRTGVTAGIDDNGALLVAVGEGRVERLVAGEVNWA